jgi:hypothetical protein
VQTIEEWKVFCRNQHTKGLKLCRECSEWKDKNEKFRYQSQSKDNRHPYCRECESEIERNRHTLETRRTKALKQKYGITTKEWDKLFDRQEKCCAICKSPEPKYIKGWCTDHDHSTMIVRSILCYPCNIVIGCIERHDIPIEALDAYLKKGKVNGKETN